MDSVRKLLTCQLRGVIAALLLLAILLGSLHNWLHKHITFLYGAMTTRLLSNFQLVSSWFLAVAIFYTFDSDPLFHGLGNPAHDGGWKPRRADDRREG